MTARATIEAASVEEHLGRLTSGFIQELHAYTIQQDLSGALEAKQLGAAYTAGVKLVEAGLDCWLGYRGMVGSTLSQILEADGDSWDVAEVFLPADLIVEAVRLRDGNPLSESELHVFASDCEDFVFGTLGVRRLETEPGQLAREQRTYFGNVARLSGSDGGFGRVTHAEADTEEGP
jgi:hypothetical protein